ncbi:hypothetical protein PISL3812_04274 [Talaromyces islandicus]|uniref:Uncharacterized protein n=1 Tax=Talaromyces islandicus TaxID=28573 RepID=A0A0U1LV28_TALIS|nr:hypothetical protein PISL3812_04274 [Talaromyces islandicus]
MPLSKENRLIFERRRREYGIVFIDSLPPREWPAAHAEVFKAIAKIQEYKYSQYDAMQNEEAGAPWKGQAKWHTRKLVEKARLCVARNESTWRFACEPLVFSRLSAEVACKACRQRVWRSEIEAMLNDGNPATRHLQARQQTRDRCRCPRQSRPDDEDERVGLNRLFIDRSDDMVKHSPPLADQLPQEQKPDHTYGLRQTRNFENLLLTPLPNGFVEDLFQNQPHSTSGEPILFPFLVLEAKAGNAADDWHSIRLQTVFPIYTYLNAQQSLRSAAAHKSRWRSGPLVWFFMSRGEDWRICLAYQSNPPPKHTFLRSSHATNIVQVWSGSITREDDALQLFLIVDYLADWARDVYRPAVLTELRILASPDVEVATIFSDTDIFSSRDITIDLPTSETWPQSDSQDTQATAFDILDTPMGAVRHISHIETRYLALIITADNIQTFFLSMSTNIRKFFVRKLLDVLHSDIRRASVLSLEALSAIEKAWTGCPRVTRQPCHRQVNFITAHIFTYFLSQSWCQVREMCVVAIAEDALDTLIGMSGLKIGHGKAVKPSMPIDEATEEIRTAIQQNTLECITKLKNCPAQHNLLAAITRVAGYIERNRDVFRFQASSPLLWELVSATYKFHKKGDLEPEVPFLRISRSFDNQKLQDNDQKPLHVEDSLHVSEECGVLIATSRSSRPLCLYIVQSCTTLPDQTTVARIIKRTFEDYDVYHTTRDNGTLNLRQIRQYRDIWNIKKSYGVFFSYGERSFRKWLKHLQMPVPTRQGSPRGPDDTGRIIFQRQYTPWHDPRLIHGGRRATMKKRFLKRLFFKEAQAWTTISRERIQRGANCCTFCAGDPPEEPAEDHPNDGFSGSEYSETERSDLCWQCEDDLDYDGCSDFPEWVTRQLIDGHSSSVLTDTLGYDIMSPELGAFNSRRVVALQTSSDSDDDSPLESFDDESTAGESSDRERRSLSNTEIPLSSDPFDPAILQKILRPFVLTQGNDEMSSSILGKRKR